MCCYSRQGKAVLLLEQARCLSHLFQDYVNESHKQQLALMTALQQVNSAEKVNSSHHEVSQ